MRGGLEATQLPRKPGSSSRDLTSRASRLEIAKRAALCEIRSNSWLRRAIRDGTVHAVHDRMNTVSFAAVADVESLGQAAVPASHSRDRRRTNREWLKALKHRHAISWRFGVRPPSLDGLVRIETRREVLWLEDGVCVHAVSKCDASPHSSDASLIGLSLVAWADDGGELHEAFSPGSRACRAIFWAQRGQTATIALTARVVAFAPVLPMTTLTRPTLLAIVGPSVRAAMDEEAATLPYYRPYAAEPVPLTLRSA